MNLHTPTSDSPVVLVVEDHPEMADLFPQMLGSEYTVIQADGGEAALEKIHSGIAVVLLDRRMPDIHGDEVLREIRSRGFDCRVVMVTAVDPDPDIIDVDFDEYLTKPVTLQEVRDVVDRMVRRNSLDDTHQEALAIASKVATLEANIDIDELESCDGYAELKEEFAAVRSVFDALDQDDDLSAEFSTPKMQSLLKSS